MNGILRVLVWRIQEKPAQPVVLVEQGFNDLPYRRRVSACLYKKPSSLITWQIESFPKSCSAKAR